MGSVENSHYTCNRKLSLQRPKHPTSTKIFKKFGPWPTELPLPAVRAKCCNIPRGTRHHHLSLSLSSALRPLQKLNLSLHCCAPSLKLQQLTEGCRNCHCPQLCQETVSMRTGLSLTAHSSPKKAASSRWGDFLLFSHRQSQSILGQRFKDKAAL